MLGHRDSNNPAEVSGYLAGLVEPALPLAGWMQRNRNQPVGLKALSVGFIGAGEPHGQRPGEAWMAAVLELVNNFFDRVLEGCPSTRDIEAIQIRRQARKVLFRRRWPSTGKRSRNRCKRERQSA